MEVDAGKILTGFANVKDRRLFLFLLNTDNIFFHYFLFLSARARGLLYIIQSDWFRQWA